jgi:hypothetical protein
VLGHGKKKGSRREAVEGQEGRKEAEGREGGNGGRENKPCKLRKKFRKLSTSNFVRTKIRACWNSCFSARSSKIFGFKFLIFSE